MEDSSGSVTNSAGSEGCRYSGNARIEATGFRGVGGIHFTINRIAVRQLGPTCAHTDDEASEPALKAGKGKCFEQRPVTRMTA